MEYIYLFICADYLDLAEYGLILHPYLYHY